MYYQRWKSTDEQEKKANEEKQRLAQVEAEKKLRAERIAKGEIVVDPLDEQQAAQDAQYDAEFNRKPASVAPSTAANKKVEDKIDLKEVEMIPARGAIKDEVGVDACWVRIQGDDMTVWGDVMGDAFNSHDLCDR